MKINIIYWAPVAYREKFFAELGRLKDINLTVYYCLQRDPIIKWEFNKEAYKSKYLFKLSVGRKFIINPGIIYHLIVDRPDILIAWGWSFPTAVLAIIFSKILSIPIFYFSDTGLPMYKPIKGFLSKILKIVKNLFISEANGFFLQGKLSKGYINAFGVSDKDIHIVPINCIDTEYWKKQSRIARKDIDHIKNRLNITAKELILYAGRLIEGKGLEILLDSFAVIKRQRPHTALLLVGDGLERKSLKEKAQRLGLSEVYFLGAQSYEMLPTHFGISDCFVLPTLSDQWPLVVLEALGCGVPVVTTTQCGSVPDLIEGKGTGFVVEPFQAEALAQAVIKALSLSPHGKKALANRAFELASRYDYRLAAGTLASILYQEYEKITCG